MKMKMDLVNTVKLVWFLGVLDMSLGRSMKKTDLEDMKKRFCEAQYVFKFRVISAKTEDCFPDPKPATTPPTPTTKLVTSTDGSDNVTSTQVVPMTSDIIPNTPALVLRPTEEDVTVASPATSTHSTSEEEKAKSPDLPTTDLKLTTTDANAKTKAPATEPSSSKSMQSTERLMTDSPVTLDQGLLSTKPVTNSETPSTDSMADTDRTKITSSLGSTQSTTTETPAKSEQKPSTTITDSVTNGLVTTSHDNIEVKSSQNTKSPKFARTEILMTSEQKPATTGVITNSAAGMVSTTDKIPRTSNNIVTSEFANTETKDRSSKEQPTAQAGANAPSTEGISNPDQNTAFDLMTSEQKPATRGVITNSAAGMVSTTDKIPRTSDIIVTSEFANTETKDRSSKEQPTGQAGANAPSTEGISNPDQNTAFKMEPATATSTTRTTREDSHSTSELAISKQTATSQDQAPSRRKRCVTVEHQDIHIVKKHIFKGGEEIEGMKIVTDAGNRFHSRIRLNMYFDGLKKDKNYLFLGRPTPGDNPENYVLLADELTVVNWRKVRHLKKQFKTNYNNGC